MLCIISPAKSLASTGLHLPIASTFPQFLTQTDGLVRALKSSLKPSDYKKLMSVSDVIAARTHSEYQTYLPNSHKSCGSDLLTSAALLFDGPAYRGLDVATLSPQEVKACSKNVRFLSGLYGWLRCNDQIQNHRLEMGTKGLPIPGGNCKLLYDYWGTSIADAIVSEFSNVESGILLNCASEEYFKVINKKLLKDKCPNITIITCAFTDKGQIKSVYAKRARGLMSRFVTVEEKIQNELNNTTKKSVDGNGKAKKAKGSSAENRLETMINILKTFDYEGYKYQRTTDNENGYELTLHFDRQTPKQTVNTPAVGSAKASANVNVNANANEVKVSKKRSADADANQKCSPEEDDESKPAAKKAKATKRTKK